MFHFGKSLMFIYVDHENNMKQVELNGMCPPIEKMDATLSTLKACK